MSVPPRGIRNNNPGNIRHGQKWDGLAPMQGDPAFATFVSPEYGIRAMAKLLLNYQSRNGLKTVRQIIDRWAPPNENNTAAYVQHVADRIGVGPDDPIVVADVLPTLVASIIRHENGQHPYDAATIGRGCDMALGKIS